MVGYISLIMSAGAAPIGPVPACLAFIKGSRNRMSIQKTSNAKYPHAIREYPIPCIVSVCTESANSQRDPELFGFR
jgi:hypothetical protein